MKVLFVTSTRIGDAVLSTGLISHLLSSSPDIRITVACGAISAPLFAAIPGVERVIPLTKQPFAGHLLRLWSETATTFWDLVVDLRASALAWLLPTRARRVLKGGDGDRATHRVVELGRLFDLDPPPAPGLWTAAADDAVARDLIPDGRPVLALGVTANWMPKIWPSGNFIALAERLTARGGFLADGRVAVFGGPDERKLALPVLNALPAARTIDLVGGQGLAVTGACLRRCELFVGNDSGLMHLAAAAGTPTLGLFGPSPPARYAPWGPHCAVATGDRSYEQLTGAADFDHLRNDNLMGSLSVDAVERAAADLSHRIKGKAA